jgi:hypothetical protein
MECKTDMTEHSIGSPVSDEVDCPLHIDEPFHGPFCHPVVHWHDDCLLRDPIHDPFQTNFFSSHRDLLPAPHILLGKTAGGLVKIPKITKIHATPYQSNGSSQEKHENRPFDVNATGAARRDKNVHRRKNTHLALKNWVVCRSI